MKPNKSSRPPTSPFKEPPPGELTIGLGKLGGRVTLSQLSRRCVKALTIVLILAIIYFVYELLKIFAGFMLASEILDADWKNASPSKKFWLVTEFSSPFLLLFLFIPLLFYLGVAFQTFDLLFLNHKGAQGQGAELRKAVRNWQKRQTVPTWGKE
jgi:hypothetical protein